MSCEALASVESQISEKFTELSAAVKSDKNDKVAKIASEIILSIEDRNKKCKVMK